MHYTVLSCLYGHSSARADIKDQFVRRENPKWSHCVCLPVWTRTQQKCFSVKHKTQKKSFLLAENRDVFSTAFFTPSHIVRSMTHPNLSRATPRWSLLPEMASHNGKMEREMSNQDGGQKFVQDFRLEQSGAVEACWAHNPEVRRSKLRSAKAYFLFVQSYTLQ